MARLGSGILGRTSAAHAHDGHHARSRPAVPRRRGGRRGGVPHAEAAADAGLSGGRRADRAQRAGAGRRSGRRARAGRVRCGVPDVRDRAGVQPAQAAQHAFAGVRPRPVAGGADDPGCGDRQRAAGRGLRGARPRLGPDLARRHHAGRGDGDVVDRHPREADGRTARARQRARPPRDGRAAVPGLGRGAAAGADPGARHRRRQPRWRAGDRIGQGRRAGDAAAGRRPARDALVAHAGGPAARAKSCSCSTCCW